MRRLWLVSLQKSLLQRITFLFVPGHAGVMGNERADRLAGLATVSEGSAMDRSDILNAIREVNRKNNLGDTMDSTSLFRLKKLGVTCGAARRESHKGKYRYFINQHRTGTLSRLVLATYLE